jgi:hypothetical protein
MEAGISRGERSGVSGLMAVFGVNFKLVNAALPLLQRGPMRPKGVCRATARAASREKTESSKPTAEIRDTPTIYFLSCGGKLF